MNNSLAFNILVSIDTTHTRGDTNLYAVNEIRRILEAGAKQMGYKIVTSPMGNLVEIKGIPIGVVASITKDKKL